MIQQILRKFDRILPYLVWTSVASYLIEVSIGGPDSLHSDPYFLWVERFVAVLFTAEYLLRWWDDATDGNGWRYPHSFMGVVDAISILPFWLGFFVPVQYLGLVRTLRILRLLKFFRYSRSLQLVALAFYRAWPHLKPLGFSMLVVCLFFVSLMYEIENAAQPDKFDSLYNTAYFTAVTIATVGYGDISPVTPLGRGITVVIFFTGLCLFAGILGVLGVQFSKVIEEEVDPNVDPLEQYQKARDESTRIKKLDKEFGPTYTTGV